MSGLEQAMAAKFYMDDVVGSQFRACIIREDKASFEATKNLKT